jgi:nucleoside-diphosphate-sugar epimerase
MARTLLITGATGFVGRNFLIAAIRSGAYQTIYVTVRSPEKLRAQLTVDGFGGLPPGVIPLVGSAADWKLGALEPVDHVVHTAGILSGRTREDYFRTNVQGTVSLLEQIQNPRAIVILSSQAAGGPCAEGQDSKSEDDRDDPVTWYGESKLELEKEVLNRFADRNVLFLRPPMVLGPRDQATLALFKLVRLPFHFKPGLRDKFYSFIAVSDLVSAVESALKRADHWKTLRYRRYFVAAGDPVSGREVLSRTAEVSRRRGVIVSVPKSVLKMASVLIDAVPRLRDALPNQSQDRVREFWPDRWVVTSRNFENAFAWRANQDLRSALQSTHDWYQKTGQL